MDNVLSLMVPVLTALPMVIYFFLVLLLEAMVALATDREVCSLEINK